MSEILSKEQSDKLKIFTDKSISVKERVSRLVNSLGEIDPKPQLSAALEEIKKQEFVLMNAYKNISDEIKETIFHLLTEMNDYKAKAVQIDNFLLDKQKETNKYCSVYSKVPPLSEHKTNEDYAKFLESYKQNIEISQQISKINFDVVDLMDVQRVLDNAFAGEIIEIEYLTSRLKEIISSFRFVKTTNLIENYQRKFCALKDLQAIVQEKNNEFDTLMNNLKKAREGQTKSKLEKSLPTEKVSAGISKDTFA